MTGWVVLYFHITSYLTESSVNVIHEDTLRRISPIRFVHSSKYDRYYTHLVFYDFMCVCLFRFHVKHINCILCSRRHVIKFLQSLRESAGRGIQCKQARVLEWTQWITLQKKERYVVVGKLPPSAVCLVLARLLLLPMFFIAVNSTNLAHQHWARRQLSVSTILAETMHNVQSWTKVLRKVDIATSSLKTKLLKALATTNTPPSPSKNVEIRLDHF